MRVSVIIPQFGRCSLTVACLSSLRRWHSSRDSLEWIVVDDGSDERDLSALRHVLPEDVRLIEQEHRGVTAAWNTGWDHSTGDVLVFLNNDTQTLNPWLSQVIEMLTQQPDALIGAEWLGARAEQGIPAACFPESPRPRLLAGWMLACRREMSERVGRFDERMRLYFSDTDWQLRWLHTFCEADSRLICPLNRNCLRHLAHATTRKLSNRSAQWKRDRKEFLNRWKNSQ
ncbi:glycosyltransferase [Rubinisphaera sp. JC750]|uniref:glycosyltransferase n=1 Tax=Rubinisphaera sp. JC750 TaxID=2898658 RepID=UPI001F2F860A|nr:glycosyltransferase [Rubinisphaera sp. JC750]